MDTDLLLPLFWTFVIGITTWLAVRKLTKKLPTKKKWVRPEPVEKEPDTKENK